MTTPDPTKIALAGAAGTLGQLMAQALVARGATVLALVRPGTAPAKLDALRAAGATIMDIDLDHATDLKRALEGAGCVVSTLNGLKPVILGTQGHLLDAAVAAGVPRFVPSDFSLDFTKTPAGSNRNLDLRRAFHQRLEASGIGWTSILNGAFMDMLTGQLPIIADRIQRILYVGDVDQKLDFTTMADTASYTAAAALDPSTPTILRIAGDTVSPRDLAAAATSARKVPYKTLRLGGVGTLSKLAKITRAVTGGEADIFPPWQGMQYMINMFSGDGRLTPLDNDRYAGLRWTKVQDLLA